MTEIDEEIARLWAQALQGETRETARARRAREADNYLERGYYRDPAKLVLDRLDQHTKKKPRKDTPKWHS